MRILGRPGTGKTILASFLVNYLAEQNEKNVLYFFCKVGETEKRETTHVLRTLLSQLLHIEEALYRDVEPLYIKSGRATADSYVRVYAALLFALSKTTRTIFILIDAIDESQDVENLLRVLFEAQRVAGGRLNLRDEPESTSYGSYFEMSYGIWNTLHLVRLPTDLDEPEITEATTVLREVTNYICSEQCLRWVETAIIIHYVGKWSKLLLNAETGLAIAKEHGYLMSIPAFQTYQDARMTFLADYTYVLQATGPDHYLLGNPAIMPDGFLTRPLAVKLLEIGHKWQEVHQ